jgi:hypothetical protein
VSKILRMHVATASVVATPQKPLNALTLNDPSAPAYTLPVCITSYHVKPTISLQGNVHTLTNGSQKLNPAFQQYPLIPWALELNLPSWWQSRSYTLHPVVLHRIPFASVLVPHPPTTSYSCVPTLIRTISAGLVAAYCRSFQKTVGFFTFSIMLVHVLFSKFECRSFGFLSSPGKPMRSIKGTWRCQRRLMYRISEDVASCHWRKSLYEKRYASRQFASDSTLYKLMVCPLFPSRIRWTKVDVSLSFSPQLYYLK